MPRLALSTVQLAVREYWTAAAALIGLCLLGESLPSTVLAPPDSAVVRFDCHRLGRVWSRAK